MIIDGENNLTDYDYDDFGRMRSVSSSDTGTATYTYDEADNLKSKTDADQVTVNYTYDELNRQTGIEFPADTSQNIGFVYDEASAVYGKGRLTSVNDPAGGNAYKYDAFGRITLMTRKTNAGTYTTLYDNNDRGNLSTLTYPGGLEIVYQRYDNERVFGVLIDGEVLTKYVTYMPFGPEEDFTFGADALTVNRTYYDNYYRLESIDAGVLNYQYTYYADGNVKTIDGIPLPGSSGSASEYLYPNGNRLVTVPPYVQTNAGRLPAPHLSHGCNHVERKAVPLRGGVNGYVASADIIHYHFDLERNLLAESEGDGTPLRDYIYQNGNLDCYKNIRRSGGPLLCHL